MNRQKSFIIPVLLFFACVGVFLVSSINPQSIRNAVWQVENNQTASTTLNWMSCIALGLMVGGIFFAVALNSNNIREFMDIGKEIPLPMRTDKNGQIVAYKVYRIAGYDQQNNPNLVSVTRDVFHSGGYLQADQKPTEQNTSGVYAMKSSSDPELEKYSGPGTLIAEVRMWGEYVEGSRGYRAEHCQAVKIIRKD